MIITRTPFRIPLGGGGTDIVSYSSKYGGALCSAAINKYMYITVNERILDKRIRVSYSKTEIVDVVNEIQHPLVREALKLLNIDGGIEITSIADVPSGSGLGSSGSFAVGLLNALHAFKRDNISYMELAEEASKIEIDILGEPIGKHDHYIAACGGITCLDIDKGGSVLAYPLEIGQNIIEEVENNTVLFYTGILRKTADVLGEQGEAIRNNSKRVLDALHRIKEIGIEIRIALETGNLRKFGELLHVHWETKKDLSSKISNSYIEECYKIARQNGALGGKIMGAGGGGFLMLYCEDGKDRLRDVMMKQGVVEMRFHFDFHGTKILLNF